MVDSRLSPACRGEGIRGRWWCGGGKGGLGKSYLRCVSEDGVVDPVVLATLLRDLDGWKGREDRLAGGSDLMPPVIGRFGGMCIEEGVEFRRSCSTNEGRVIVDIYSDGFDLRPKALLE